MAHGGNRPGAGRPHGAVTVKSRAVVEKIIGDGSTPLEVMIRNMRFYDEEATRLVNQLMAAAAAGTAQLEVSEGEGGEPQGDVVEQLRLILMLREKAGNEAARAAPYVHPRIGYDRGQSTGDPEFVPLAERLLAYQRRDELAAAGGNIVELKPSGDQ